jgi:hypothetical protein
MEVMDGAFPSLKKKNKALIKRKLIHYEKSVMSNKNFHVLLNFNDVLRSIAVCHFAIRMPLTIHLHSARCISVDRVCLEK